MYANLYNHETKFVGVFVQYLKLQLITDTFRCSALRFEMTPADALFSSI